MSLHSGLSHGPQRVRAQGIFTVVHPRQDLLQDRNQDVHHQRWWELVSFVHLLKEEVAQLFFAISLDVLFIY